jgi:hypothetical protein
MDVISFAPRKLTRDLKLPQPERVVDPKDFLDFPGEIRNRIYDYLFAGSVARIGCHKDVFPNSDILTIENRQPAISKVCRQLRYETLSIFYSRTRFEIRCSHPCQREAGSKWLETIQPYHHHITSLAVWAMPFRRYKPEGELTLVAFRIVGIPTPEKCQVHATHRLTNVFLTTFYRKANLERQKNASTGELLVDLAKWLNLHFRSNGSGVWLDLVRSNDRGDGMRFYGPPCTCHERRCMECDLGSCKKSSLCDNCRLVYRHMHCRNDDGSQVPHR